MSANDKAEATYGRGRTTITIKRSRNRKPTAPRTCCKTHTDTCRFGKEHAWGIGWVGGPLSGVGVGEEGWHDSMLCVTCKGICTADMEDGGRP